MYKANRATVVDFGDAALVDVDVRRLFENYLHIDAGVATRLRLSRSRIHGTHSMVTPEDNLHDRPESRGTTWSSLRRKILSR